MYSIHQRKHFWLILTNLLYSSELEIVDSPRQMPMPRRLDVQYLTEWPQQSDTSSKMKPVTAFRRQMEHVGCRNWTGKSAW